MNAHEREAVFRRWLADHTGLVLKVVRSFAAVPQDQDDLLQDILVQLWSSIPGFQGAAKETTWIYRVAFNTAMVWSRRERRRRTGHATVLALDPPAEMEPSHLEAQQQREIVDQLYAAIRQLPKIDASLALMHLDGLSYQEMADVLGISANHVGVKLNRIRRQLADSLKGTNHEL